MTEERYERHSHLPGWNQARLTEATVVIMGMGALGNAVAQALALAGVGRLILCDMDRIERTNLSRMPLFRESDIGRYKVEAAAERLAQLAPGIRIEARPTRLEHGVGLGELREAQLVLGCLDSRAARLELAGRCGLAGAPWIDGATGGWSGEVRSYLDPAGPCYGCGLDDAARSESDTPRSCRLPAEQAPQGAAAPISLLVGAHMALLAVRYLIGLPVDGAIKVVDGHSGLVTAVRQTRDPSCPYHFRLPTAEQIPLTHRAPVSDLLALLEPDEVPLAWRPFQIGVRCRNCGFSKSRTGLPATEACPQCSCSLQSQTVLELTLPPTDTRLDRLGVAPGEILAVRSENHFRYIRLTIEEARRP